MLGLFAMLFFGGTSTTAAAAATVTVTAVGAAAVTKAGTSTAITAVKTASEQLPPVLGPQYSPPTIEERAMEELLKQVPGEAVKKAKPSIIDNIFRDPVSEPEVGSVLYCALHHFEHSGIYVGNKQIVHLDGDGQIELVTPKEFINRLEGINTAISIYVSCIDTIAVGFEGIGLRAKSKVGEEIDYNLITRNCHQFTAGCLSGDFKSDVTTFFQLEDECRKVLGLNTWRVWDLTADELF